MVLPYLVLAPPDAPQRKYDLREVFNALRWMVRTGAQREYLPHDFPPPRSFNWEMGTKSLDQVFTDGWEKRRGTFDTIRSTTGRANGIVTFQPTPTHRGSRCCMSSSARLTWCCWSPPSDDPRARGTDLAAGGGLRLQGRSRSRGGGGRGPGLAVGPVGALEVEASRNVGGRIAPFLALSTSASLAGGLGAGSKTTSISRVVPSQAASV